MIERRPRIIDVERKPQKCPVCGERVVDIIYGTGDMTEIEFLLEYRKEGMMGGDNIPRRPPIWECVCGCRRFRKVNWDGTDAPVKVKMLKNVRKAPETLINWESNMAIDAVGKNELGKTLHYKVEVRTELGEKEIVKMKNRDQLMMVQEMMVKSCPRIGGPDDMTTRQWTNQLQLKYASEHHGKMTFDEAMSVIR